MNKKIILVISTIIMLSMLISAPTAHAAQPASQIKPMTTISIIQGKITPSGVFFLILEKTPALNQYNTIQFACVVEGKEGAWYCLLLELIARALYFHCHVEKLGRERCRKV